MQVKPLTGRDIYARGAARAMHWRWCQRGRMRQRRQWKGLWRRRRHRGVSGQPKE
jgi:hypothetical protein